ncbi:endonuclease III [Deinococcus proteolyticus MRP]|uniref:Endonuclease III n=1 Tax=Deinococcus proteolyticus (strain ATCC 35074 / DSM 20540 / JCM 6276 / NBRC 101906 / NCIMB 13154 / VKM Ac-1939 / CCM 2703 / MRP) TaxID=693977 RepID=F0RPE3_DEIPM|nr:MULTISPECIES: endonuclease III [Deinococcus]ADY26486.1 endonuclease III [Deinococcus proteolyticus MRP]MCY1702604.1 endonuclease III [Deinococcus sp. SL84]
MAGRCSLSSVTSPSRKKPVPRLPAGARLRAPQVLASLRALYPDARTELEFRTPFELLVATVLSAQATDVSVNAATPALFAAYPDAAAMSLAEPEDIEPYIRRIGLYRAKAKNLAKLARQLTERHGGEVPDDFEAVVALAGAGRKTANVVLSNAYGRPAIAVDTHVGRLSRRLGLSAQTDPDRVEADLMRLFAEGEWIFLHHALILHGRRICVARRPLCSQCIMANFCPKVGVDPA